METHVDNGMQVVCEKDPPCDKTDLVEVLAARSAQDSPPRVLACPSRVRKAMVRNLRAAARSKIGPARAAIAWRLLRALEHHTPAVLSAGKNVAAASEEKLAVAVNSAPAAVGNSVATPARGNSVVAGVFRRLRAVFREHMARPLLTKWQTRRWWPQGRRAAALD
jgi:hypothetical protein